MTAKLRAWSGLAGCLVLLVAMAPVMNSDVVWAAPGDPSGSPTPVAPTGSPDNTTAGVPAVPVDMGDTYVKYYTVAKSYQDAPENLTEIATRFLGGAGRAEDIYHLNVGRKQPDGGKLTESKRLSAGWSLVLPWDAYGDGVRNGVLPTKVPVPAVPAGAAVANGQPNLAPPVASTTHAPTPITTAPHATTKPTTTSPRPDDKPPARPDDKSPAQPGNKPPAHPGNKPPVPPGDDSPVRPGNEAATPPSAGSPSASAPPAVPASPPAGRPSTGGKAPKPPRAGQCSTTTPSRKDSGWAQERMAADRAWSRTQGEGVLVAVVDSGVDGSVPELNGRVAVGADIPSGSGRGDTDCLGSGTAMAGIIAARPAADVPAPDGQVTGIAPGATILPLRVVSSVPQSQPADAATAIEVAVSAGAKVVALGSYVNLSDQAVLDKIKLALAHDVVVVAPAMTTSAGPKATPSGTDGVLWVAGVGPDGQPSADYLPGAVDVTAPGIDVASLGPGGTGVASSGSQYAVAFAAGAVTLVRSAYPNLSAAQVVGRIKATAEHAGGDVPDPHTGYGMVNSDAAVTMVLAAESQTVDLDEGGSGPLRTLTIALLIVIGLAAIAVLGLRSRVRPRAVAPATADAAEQPQSDTDQQPQS